ncbi:MAG: EAL domain-containing protein [Chloroflexi bacterium]|nr:EAL domain-containing protein [Chloroflexota bacterium]
MDPESEQPAFDEQALSAGGGLRLVRLRLWLALIATFLLPFIISTPIFSRITSPATDLLGPTVGLIGVALGLGLVIAWLAKRVLEPAAQLEAARSYLRGAYDQAREDSLIDPLTRLGNHRAFQEELDRQLATASRYGGSVALVIIDLDGFKKVNDTMGHAAGDRLLHSVAGLIANRIRRADRPFRTGGDEFAVIMPQTTSEPASIPISRLLAAALGDAMPGERTVPFSFSAGIADFPGQATDRNELLRFADAAMYWGKRHGRTAVTVFDATHLHAMTTNDRASPETSTAVERVAARRLLRAVYQPIVDLGDGSIIGFEGLIRPTPDSGFSNPGALFEAAEAAGRTTELDLACLETVIATSAKLGLQGHLGLNLSPRTLEAPEFNVGSVSAILRHYGVEPDRVVIELTEREHVEDLTRLRHSIEAIRAAGLRVAADDVGAGNAGLRLLSQSRFDIVKIDLSLVQGGAMRNTSFEILQTLRDLAQRWQALVVAEGVETPEQLVVVRALGLTAAQGYLLGRPTDTPSTDPIDLDRLGQLANLLDAPVRLSA